VGLLFSYSVFSQTAEPPGAAPSVAPAAGSVAPSAASPAGTPETAAPAAEGAGAGADNAGPAVHPGEEALLFSDDLPEPAPGRVSAFPAILRMVLVLALVAALIYLVVFFLRRLSRPQVEQNPHLKILASTHLGGGRYVHVVSLGTKAWLIGAGEGGINPIAEITDQEAVDAMALEASKKYAEKPVLPAFQELLKKFSGGAAPREQNYLENIKQRRERFKRF
jgi:flagellar protein FliO/FliZ